MRCGDLAQKIQKYHCPLKQCYMIYLMSYILPIVVKTFKKSKKFAVFIGKYLKKELFMIILC